MHTNFFWGLAHRRDFEAFGKGNNAEADINLLENRFLDDLEHMFEVIPKNIRWFHPKVGRAVITSALTP
jgi:hypothetical protein